MAYYSIAPQELMVRFRNLENVMEIYIRKAKNTVRPLFISLLKNYNKFISSFIGEN